jgi:hypothetical protein
LQPLPSGKNERVDVIATSTRSEHIGGRCA